MSRPLHPLALRVGRAERAQIVAFARAQGMSISGVLKVAVRLYVASQPVPAPQPPVYGDVNKHPSDPPMLPALLTPHRLPRQPGIVGASAFLRQSNRDGERKGLLSDTG